ncbi:3-dehydroquinate synthase, partial [termite gut metagenome]
MNKQAIILCHNPEEYLAQALAQAPHDKLFVLTDERTCRLCLPRLKEVAGMEDAIEITIRSGDTNKTAETLIGVWQVLSDKGATRYSLLINLGGGMVTDLGGFAAATFKRGIA